MGWASAIGIIWRLLRGASGSSVADTADRIAERLAALQSAKTEVERAEIEREIVQLKAIHDLQRPSSRAWFSPMMLGQYLVVLPFGAWFAAIHVVSIINGNLGTTFVIQDLPPHVFDLAEWLIPVIIVGTLLERRK